MQIFKKLSLCISVCTVSCAVLYFGVLSALPHIIDLNEYKDFISESIEKETGFKFSCEDISLKKSYSPYLNIHLFHTIVLYPDSELFLKLKEIDFKVKILPLIFKNISLKDVKLTRPIINITMYKDFSTSLEKYINPEKTINANGFKLYPVIYDTVCVNYRINIKDDSINKVFYLEGNNLELKDFKLNENVNVILKGSLYEGNKEYLKYDLNLVSILDKNKKQFSFSPFKHIIESDVNAKIIGNLKLDKNKNINGKLKINDLSLKIDNVLLSDNKIDLIFKGNEVLIDSVLHTSKNDKAELKGKFLYGKRNYIDINTNAENINIENLWKVISELSNILNLKNKYQDICLKGILNAKFNISSDFKKLKSNGNAKIFNAILKHNSLPYAVTDINADINFDNNRILIDKTSAKINKTPINIQGVLNEDVSYDVKIFSDNLNLFNFVKMFELNEKIPFKVIAGKFSFDSQIKGILNKNYKITSNIKFNSLRIKDKKLNIPINSDALVLNFDGNDKKYSGEILCNNFNTLLNKQKISSKELRILFDEKNINIPENIINTSGEFKISGIINNYINTPSGYIKFNGNISSEAVAGLIKPYIKLPYKAIGNIHSVGKLIFSKQNINVKAQFKSDKNNYLSFVVIKELLNKPSLFNIDCDISNNSINIKDISIFEDNINTISNKYNDNLEKLNKVLSINGNILNNENIIFKNIKIIIPSFLTVATNFFGGEELSLNGNIILNNTIKNPDIKGNLKVNKYNIKKYLTSITNADISLNSDNIRIIAPNVQVNNSALNIIADVKPFLDVKNIVVSNLQLNSINLDLNSLFGIIQQEFNSFSQPFLTVKKGSVTINNLKLLDLKSKDISSDISIEKNLVKLSNIAANAYNGTISGEMDYDLSSKFLNINMAGKGIDIKTSLYDLCKISDNIAGKADFNANISLYTGTYNQSLKSLSGKVNYEAKNGRMGTLGKFEYYLYAQNLLYHGLLNATLNRIADTVIKDNTAHYKESKGNLLFQNGYMIADSIKTIGSNMSLFVKGRHNILTNQANIDIYGRISDDVKYKLGSFGNVSISELVNGQQSEKSVTIMKIPNNIISEIPDLYSKSSGKTNTFKVNIYGNINSLNAINSFVWIVGDNNYGNKYTETEKSENNELPDFSDMIQSL